ncbi:MAG TPA: pyruvate:ferredoxin (flavodoxin) oxidoreductase, partial [Anaerovoracaceae bacterium]|nr:pyruvate:ferredoxin (flavodoxin) oxidoreductase [Anaerovoracaceae bacterium]
LTTTYTASQGLLLMVPNMYKIAGELLPGVFHVSARSLSIHGLSIFGDHSDVMACRQTGFSLLAASSPQEVMDLGAVAHLSAIRSRVPFLHFFDGFRTSHELQKIEVLDYNDLDPLLDRGQVDRFRHNALNPAHPFIRGTTINPDIYFQGREAQNLYYEAVPAIVEHYMGEINKLTGRNYKLFEYYGAPDAARVIIAMGSVTETVKETVDYLMTQGRKVGLLCVHLYRPFSIEHFIREIPATVERVAVLDRTKEPGSVGEPLYLDVANACRKAGRELLIVGGRYGLSSKDTTPADIIAVYDNLDAAKPKDSFTISINDDVTHLSLPRGPEPEITPEGRISCKIWGLGADGTVGANKNSIKIIGQTTDMYTQAYFAYDAKKSGGVTQSHLRFGKDPIRSPYYVSRADFVACHAPSYVDKYDLAKDLKDGGIFLLNCPWKTEELEEKLPAELKRGLAAKNAHFYIIDALGIASGLGLGGRTNSVLQSAFFKLVDVIPLDVALEEMKNAVRKTYAKKGKKVVEMNVAAIDAGIDGLVEVTIPDSWKDAGDAPADLSHLPEFVREVVIPMNRQEGDDVPVSMYGRFNIPDGTFPSGMTKYEKRGVAVSVPHWDIDNCIQCNQCALVCPHAVIRPILLDEEEKKNAPPGFETKKAIGKGLENYAFRIQVSPYDCTGCGSCAEVCPAKNKALKMKPLEEELQQHENWTFAVDNVRIKPDAVRDTSVKHSQFAQPLFEFSGACAGCGETPYIKLATQLFGDRMYIANASGCSSAYGGTPPSIPYAINREGEGPAWAMSLFEDNAEYAYGMLLGSEKVRSTIADKAGILKDTAVEDAVKAYLEERNDASRTRAVSSELIAALEAFKPKNDKQKEARDFILTNRDYLRKKSYWAFGGDGWAYDIGYGGLDHVLASGKNINVLVLDTEVYSNTGGQSSKAAAAGAVAKFAADGKKTKKKDLGMMAMSYGYVYVAQVAMGYDQNQVLTAMREAEAYDGPSLIIAYCPCIEHGPKCGMGKSQQEMKEAVESGYWHLYRYNPELKKEGKNPFIMDSKPPTKDLITFLRGENRYATLERTFPDLAPALFEKARTDAAERLANYQRLAKD